MTKKLKILTDEDYVVMYAEALKNDASLFKQQKVLIDSQMQMSRSFFKNAFAGRDFKEAARAYLREMGMIR